MSVDNISNILPQCLNSGFIDYSIPSNENYRPSLVLNDPPRSKVIHTLCRELETCSSFEFSVAFITSGGIMMLLQSLYEAKKRGVKGKILTSDYLGFTDPKALSLLLNKLDNIEIKMYRGDPFHAKGYLFHYENNNYSSILIGSSNITQKALSTNREWNIRLISLETGEVFRKVHEEFVDAWDKAFDVSPAMLIQYEQYYNNYHRERDFAPSILPEEDSFDQNQIAANSMQKEALESLETLRMKGETKAIIISATGTGKTFLSAFDVKRFAPRKFLFIVHRQQIATESMRKFQQILGRQISCSVLGGGVNYDKDAVYTFSMIQTLSKDDTLNSFSRDEFDYIVVDEVHRAGASSYEKVLSYFTPKFLLGMTATPERSDGFDIYSLFDNNIAYEIRLNQALKANLLCPFHYFGISDLVVDETIYEDLSQFSQISNEEQIKTIKMAIDRYSVPGLQKRGLIFVSRNEDGKTLSEELNRLGLRTLALSGLDNDKTREAAFDSLENSEIEYLIAVDILNEGIDIPSLNQIIMLRPTQSAIIFVQQMGRGLRKHSGKEFLTVIDFIGNYSNNYMIPIALFGDTTYSKDTLRKYMSSGSLGIYGVSTVHFDKIAKERIYQAINDASFKTIKFLKNEYVRVKIKIGHTPRMIDFIEHGAVSPLLFISYCKNFYEFKMKAEKPWISDLSIAHSKSLNFLSKVLAPGIRPYEAMIISHILTSKEPLSIQKMKENIQKKYNFIPEEESIRSSIAILSNRFYSQKSRNHFDNIIYCKTVGDTIEGSEQFLSLMQNNTYREEIEDILKVAEHEYRRTTLSNRVDNDIILYHKYSREDVCRLLNWEKDEHATMFGYKVHYHTMTCPIFVTYNKRVAEIDPSINYEDHFINHEEFAWETRTNITLESSEPKAIRNEKGHLKKYLFIQKNNDEGIAFYYMGEIEFLSNTQSHKKDGKGKLLPVVAMTFRLHTPVSPDLYEYITG